MDNKDDIEAFSAGIDKEHHTWLTSTLGILSYDEYMDLIWSIVDNMKEDLGRIDKSEFKLDMENITRDITKEPKNHRPKLNPDDIVTPELKMKEISTNNKLTLNINLDELKSIHMFNDHILVVTNNYFLSLIPRDTYHSMMEMLAPKQVESFMEKGHIQYILFNYQKTVASMEKLIIYAGKNNLLVDDQKDNNIEDVFNSLNLNEDTNKDNVLKFSTKTK
ncbi:hypothetical protein D1B17_11910 [Companilactobacillus zhachilii]|uniref:Uncharacterized protein n=1 Tax=Companilactobacillus zhachilii TaxID=2304606 RepID=A0A386PUM2_9LACO|nr:hypothetical protein [Companilactobacillus zhachilii]AYE39292.1 hypothetical protein D1B17_11910 [Companilactobacillus zhachilii]